MTYNPSIPASGQSLGETRAPIQINFEIIDTRFSVNHVPFNDVGGGKHNFLSLPNRTTGDPSTAAAESALYAKADGDGVSQVYVRGESDGNIYQISTFNQANQGTFGTDPGWTSLPGGLYLQYGSFNPGALTGNQNFNFTFPNAIFQVQLQNSITGSTITNSAITSIATNKFGWRTTTYTVTPAIYWLAIGN